MKLMTVTDTFYFKDFMIIGGRLDNEARVGMKVQVLNEGVAVAETTIDEIKQFKSSYESLQAGEQCGLRVAARIPTITGFELHSLENT